MYICSLFFFCKKKGRAIIAAAMLRGDTFKECIGIELLSPLVDASKIALGRYEEVVKKKPNLYPYTKISFHEGDILAEEDTGTGGAAADEAITLSSGVSWSHADFVFANSTCFGHELMVRKKNKDEAFFSSFFLNCLLLLTSRIITKK
jgi:hypothetical protein